MNKTAIKNFAIWARNKLIAEISYKAGLLGVTGKGINNPLPQSTNDIQFFAIGTKEPYAITGVEIEQRKRLVDFIQQKESQSDYKTAYNSVVEEVAYTWFNRLIAVRFMEVNDYLPSRIRVLSSESTGKQEPDLVTNPFEAGLEYTPYENDRIVQLKHENKLDELFRMLFIKQCNALNAILPELFEKTNDYTELLMNVSFTDQDGVVYRLVHDIPEDDFTQAVEIIGWMYQYYNEERKNAVINIYKGTIKKQDIPAATQLFTTDWVVRYMVDNSLGRYWIERNPESKLRSKLQFFVEAKSGGLSYVDEKIDPQDLTFFDPCMGSGHILVYAFDVLMEVYRERGFSDRDAAVCIITDNLFGLDIDDRAYQLAYFAVMMKARSYNRRILTMKISPNVCAIQESNGISTFAQDGVTVDSRLNAIGEYLIRQYRHAKEIGSLQTVDEKDYSEFEVYLRDCEKIVPMDLFSAAQFNYTANIMRNLVQQAKIMSKKYTVVCTNPPYMNKLESHLKEFVINEYKPYSGDLFSVFMYRNFGYCKAGGFSAFMTPFVWMFIKTYENLREFIINNKSIVTLVQMEYSAFEEATVPICSFVLKNKKDMQKGYYFKLSDFKGGMEVQKQKVIEALADKNCGYLYETNAENFSKISGMPIAYWISERLASTFESDMNVEVVARKVTKGIYTGNNDKYLRLWYEVSSIQIKNDVWHKYSKGGSFRKWYGNSQHVVLWENDAFELRSFSGSGMGASKYYNYPHIVWSGISTGKPSFRYDPDDVYFDDVSPAVILCKEKIHLIIAQLNSIVSEELLKVIAPTMHFQIGDIKRLPLCEVRNYDVIIDNVEQNIDLSRADWNLFELSWDFVRHPLITYKRNGVISKAFEVWEQFTEKQVRRLKSNEEKLNRIFIDVYGMQNELSPEVDDKEITIRKAELGRDIRSFLSYAVGCMFGRYSLEVEGLVYAGGDWDDSKYSTFIPDKNNIIPITDEEYFEDDVVGLFCAFLKKTFGADTLEENLDFIAKALGNKGDSSRDVIRNYFLKDFFKDHCKIYQKRPIYWLFDSGKADGFKALIYLHRYNADTIGNLRIDYLHRIQRVYDSEIVRMQETIDNSTNAREVAAASKRKDKLVKQQKETKEYDEKIAHLALARIELDLDDGVKVNYEKVQTGTDGKKLEVLAKI